MASRLNNFREERNICRFFTGPEGCWYGETCRFEHHMPYDMYSGWYQDGGRYQRSNQRGGPRDRGFVKRPPPPPPPQAPPMPAYYEVIPDPNWVAPCKFFNSPAGCKNGDYCMFYHAKPQNTPRNRRNDHNNNHNNNTQLKGRPIKVNEIACGECGKVSKGGDGHTAKQNLKQHYMDKLMACDDNHIKYFLAEADFHMRDLLCFACGRKFEEVQDLLHHFFRQVKNKNKKKFKHQEQLSRIARPFVERDWNNTLQHKIPEGSPNDAVKDSFTMQLLKCMVKHKELQDSKEVTGKMMRSLARMAKISESSGGGGSTGKGNSVVNGTAGHSDNEDDDDDELDSELENEIEERAKNYGFTKEELDELLSHGIKPWDDSEVDPWDFLEQLHAERASSSNSGSNRVSPDQMLVNGSGGEGGSAVKVAAK